MRVPFVLGLALPLLSVAGAVAYGATGPISGGAAQMQAAAPVAAFALPSATPEARVLAATGLYQPGLARDDAVFVIAVTGADKPLPQPVVQAAKRRGKGAAPTPQPVRAEASQKKRILKMPWQTGIFQ